MSSSSEGNKMESEPSDECDDSKFSLFSLEVSEGRHHTLLQAPKVVGGIKNLQSRDAFNLLMADVSGSMHYSWPHVVRGWNEFIKDKLYGCTKLYTFDHAVRFKREGTELKTADNTGGSTNITQALEEIRRQVQCCKQSFVQVFIITDGAHIDGYPMPETVIHTLIAPPRKTVNVYLLGISRSFPVNYSIDIRSRLHNGSANLPSLYWAKETEDIVEQMSAIGTNIGCHVKMVLNQGGSILPGLPSTQTIQPDEWLYFEKNPKEIGNLKVRIEDELEEEIPQEFKEASVVILLDKVFPQWNSVLIKQHRNKENNPKEVLGLMDSLFKRNFEKYDKNFSLPGKEGRIKERMEKKNLKTLELRYNTMMKHIRSVIEVEGKYVNEVELANNILKSTVSGLKYDVQVLKIRGHGLDDYEKDKNEFFDIYRKHKEAIMALPEVQSGDCCCITASSTLRDLQDDDFLELENEDKFEFLKTFTMSGIPVYAPVRDSTKINPWTLTIHHVLVAPYAILSQRAIEEYAGQMGEGSIGTTDKEVQLKADDENTKFNVIIPTIPPNAAAVLKPLVSSKLYAMLATFCILKDPHIIDYSAHLAGLACTWVKSIAQHPPTKRPAYITDRLASIAATAEIYMERKGIVNYLETLVNTPNKALITEFTDPSTNQTLKCESLVKPLFFLGMRRDKFTTDQLTTILGLLLREFIGRCLSGYKVSDNNATPFTDFFVAELADPKKRDELLAQQSQDIIDEFKASSKDMLKEYFTLESVQKAIKKFFKSKIATLSDHLMQNITVAVNMEKVKRLKYIGGCGDVLFYTFKAFAQEMAVPEQEILAAYDPSQITVHVCEALSFRSSKDRMEREQRSYDECMKHIKAKLYKENEGPLLESLKKKESEIVDEWRREYLRVHEPLVRPLTPKEVVSQAQARNIEVTEETFSQVYKYNANTGLLFNACMIPGCPYYLVPSRSFNQHISVERASENFPHSLHLVTKEHHSEGVDKVVELIISGAYSGQKKRKRKPMSQTDCRQKLKAEIEELLKMYSSMSTQN